MRRFAKDPPANGDRRISDQDRGRLESTPLVSRHRGRQLGGHHTLNILRWVLSLERMFKRLDVFRDIDRGIGHQELGPNAQSAKKLAAPGALRCEPNEFKSQH
jgi:hypothetical protein